MTALVLNYFLLLFKLPRIKTPSGALILVFFLWLLNKCQVLQQRTKVLANSINITELPHYCFYLLFYISSLPVYHCMCGLVLLLHARRPISARKKNSLHFIPCYSSSTKAKTYFRFFLPFYFLLKLIIAVSSYRFTSLNNFEGKE